MNYKAETNYKECWLTSPWAVEMACKWFGLTEAELETLVGGRKTRGARKGLLRGQLCWAKTVRGGWVKLGAYDFDQQRGTGYVIAPGKVVCKAIRNADGAVVRSHAEPGFETIVERL